MKQSSKKLLSLVLTAALLCSLLIIPAAAAGEITGTTEITAGGEYIVAKGTTGTITIKTTDKVTLTGGYKLNSDLTQASDSYCFDGLTIDCSAAPGAKVELKNMGITAPAGNSIVEFAGTGNVLTISGTNLVDYQPSYGAAGAAFHVGVGADLLVNGSGTLYLYKSASGAGFGGKTSEMNGNITFGDSASANLKIFGKGSKQSALIGAGANANSTTDAPGSITFNNGTYNLMSVSRGACIGGAAGASGGSTGTAVYVNGGSININVDYSGAAVGGGGYDGGNDSSGGTIYISGGSLRTYVDKNAASATTGYKGVAMTEGVNDAPITAQRLNNETDKETVYKCVFDTSLLETPATEFTVKVDGADYFSGGLHSYKYMNESVEKDSQTVPNSTPENWIASTDSNLYLYLTGADHTITINGETFTATYDAAATDQTVMTTGAFTVAASTDPDPSPSTDPSPSVDPSPSIPTGNPDAAVWDGTLDFSWYDEANVKTEYHITKPAQWAALAWICSEHLGELDELGEGTYTNGNITGITGTVPTAQQKFAGVQFYLDNDIDMGGVYNAETGAWSGPKYYPVGTSISDDLGTGVFYGLFYGSFNGQGHVVKNIYCERIDSTGNYKNSQHGALFGRIGAADGNEAPANNITIENVAVTGYISGGRSCGGVVGKTLSVASGYSVTVKNCLNFATVITNNGAKGVGGVVGALWNGASVENCANFGSVTGTYSSANAAGVSGAAEGPTTNSYNVGTVTNTAKAANSGAVALNQMTANVTNCWALEGSAPGYTTSIVNGNTLVSGGFMTADSMKSAAFAATLSGDNAGAWVIPGASEAIASIMTAAGVSGYPVPAVFAPNSGAGKTTVSAADMSGGNAQFYMPISVEGIPANTHKIVITGEWHTSDMKPFCRWNIVELNKAQKEAGITGTLVNNMNGDDTLTIEAADAKTLADGIQCYIRLIGGSGTNNVVLTSAKFYNEAGDELTADTVMVSGSLNIDENKTFTVTVTPSDKGTTTFYWKYQAQESAASYSGIKPSDVIDLKGTGNEGYDFVGYRYQNEMGDWVTKNAGSSFTMPNQDLVLEPIFGVAYTITVDNTRTTGGTASCTLTSSAAGKTVSLNYQADECYAKYGVCYEYIDPATNEKVTVGPLKGKTQFTMPDADVTVWMQWEKMHTITIPQQPVMGEIIMNYPPHQNPYMAQAGNEITFFVLNRDKSTLNATPVSMEYSTDNGQTWTEIPKTNRSLSTNWGYTRCYWRFNMPDADIQLRATVVPYPFFTVADGIEHGTLTFKRYTNSETSTYGTPNGSLGLNITPEDGYYLKNVEVKNEAGETCTLSGQYIECPQTGNFTVTPEFALMDYTKDADLTISTAEELVNFATSVKEGNSYLGKLVKLGADIDLTGIEWSSAGDSLNSFCGIFYGNGYEITGFAGPSSLFGSVTYATLKDVVVRGAATFENNSPSVITGYATSTLFDGCINYVDATYDQYNYFGAIVMSPTNCVLRDCANYGSINAKNNYVGGLVGLIQEKGSVTLERCANYGSIACNAGIGCAGLVGYIQVSDTSTKVSITDCVNKGSVSCSGSKVQNNSMAAGIANVRMGGAQIVLNNCYNTGAITVDGKGQKREDSSPIAGIAAIAKTATVNQLAGLITVSNCYNTGVLTKNGVNATTTSTAYDYGEIIPDYTSIGTSYAGFEPISLVDLDRATVLNCYTNADIETMDADAAVSALGNGYQESCGSTPILMWETPVYHNYENGVCTGCGATTDSPYTVSLVRMGEGNVFAGDTVKLQVKVSGTDFDGANVSIKYNTDLFTFVPDETDSSVVESDGTITILTMKGGYPAGSVIATLTFTANEIPETQDGGFIISSATADTFESAASGNSKPCNTKNAYVEVGAKVFFCTTFADYVTGYTLVVVESNQPYAYDGNAMYLVEAYDTSAEGSAYAYLVKGAITSEEAATHLTTVVAPAAAITAGDTDVNNTGKVDFNDALAGMACYKVLYDIDQYMAQYFRADVNGDHIVNAADVNAILAGR
jgi:hypothetical protein